MKALEQAKVEALREIAEELKSIRQSIDEMKELAYNVMIDNDIIDDTYLPDYMQMPDLSFLNIIVDVNKRKVGKDGKAKRN